MSYGVNTWAGQRGRARAAGSSKRKSTRTAKRKRSSSARRAKKKSSRKGRARSAAKKATAPLQRSRRARRALMKGRAPKPSTKVQRKPKARKARLFTRYDPTTGQKVRVTADTFEYREWPSRKPSKKKIAREAFKSDPLGTSGSVAQQAAKRAIERAGEQTITRVLRSARAAVLPAAAAAGGTAFAATGAASILAAAYLVGDRIARDQRLKLGDRLNAISLRFTETQRQLEAAFGTNKWDGVPADLRAKAVRDYKSAIATATSRAQGQAFAGARAEGSYK